MIYTGWITLSLWALADSSRCRFPSELETLTRLLGRTGRRISYQRSARIPRRGGCCNWRIALPGHRRFGPTSIARFGPCCAATSGSPPWPRYGGMVDGEKMIAGSRRFGQLKSELYESVPGHTPEAPWFYLPRLVTAFFPWAIVALFSCGFEWPWAPRAHGVLSSWCCAAAHFRALARLLGGGSFPWYSCDRAQQTHSIPAADFSGPGAGWSAFHLCNPWARALVSARAWRLLLTAAVGRITGLVTAGLAG